MHAREPPPACYPRPMTSPPRSARRIDWRPVRAIPQFVYFATHRLEQVGDQQLAFVETPRRRLHKLSLLLLVPLSPVLSAVSAWFFGYDTWLFEFDHDHTIMMLKVMPIATLFMVVAAMMWMTRGPIFDRERNEYACRRVGKQVDSRIPLSRIRALQLIETEFDGQLELNLVLDDGARINVVAHGDYPPLYKEAARLGEWLGVPVRVKSG